MHVNGGMSRFVFSLFIKLKKKSFQLKLAASPDLIMLISLISAIRQRQDQKQADIWALRIVVDSIMFAVLSGERARETLTFAARCSRAGQMSLRLQQDFTTSASALTSEPEHGFVSGTEATFKSTIPNGFQRLFFLLF